MHLLIIVFFPIRACVKNLDLRVQSVIQKRALGLMICRCKGEALKIYGFVHPHSLPIVELLPFRPKICTNPLIWIYDKIIVFSLKLCGNLYIPSYIDLDNKKLSNSSIPTVKLLIIVSIKVLPDLFCINFIKNQIVKSTSSKLTIMAKLQ